MEIKFRGMDLKGRWFYGLPCHIQTDKASAPKGWYISNSVGVATAYPVRPETVTQFTGLFDKLGKEIYQGDIVRIGALSPKKKVIEWIHRNNNMVGFNLGPGKVDKRREIIGNIYENPDLISHPNTEQK